MKKLLALLLALMLGISCVACGAADSGTADTPDADQPADAAADTDATAPADSDTDTDAAPTPTGGDFDDFARPRTVEAPRVGFLSAVSSDEAHNRAVHQAEIECEHRGWELVYTEYTDDEDCVAQMTSLIAQDVDAIILHSITSIESKEALIAQARAAGIGVYSLDSGMVNGCLMNVCAANGVAGMQVFYQVGADYNWDFGMTILYLSIVAPMTERLEPIRSILNNDTLYPNVTLLNQQDLADFLPAPQTQEFEYTKTWIEQYGKDLDFILCGSDGMCVSVNEVCKSMGYDWIKTAGFDGSSVSFAYLRDPASPTAYIYAQPLELYCHTVFESIDALQVKGLNPGDDGCNIAASGATIFCQGTLVNKDTVPAVGETFHEAFDYFDANDSTGWWTWTEAGGASVIGSGESA